MDECWRVCLAAAVLGSSEAGRPYVELRVLIGPGAVLRSCGETESASVGKGVGRRPEFIQRILGAHRQAAEGTWRVRP